MATTPDRPLQIDSAGIAPFAYRVCTRTEAAPAADLNAGWATKAVQLQSVQLGYGLGPHQARFSMKDPDSITDDNAAWLKPHLSPPSVQDGVTVHVRDADGERLVFRGSVASVADNTTDGGKLYQIEAVSAAARLNDYAVTLTFNQSLESLQTAPTFDANGYMVRKLHTIKEMVDAVMAYPNAFGTTEYFTAGSISWGTLETDARCGAFIPPETSFSDIGKGAAVLSILEQAGNFHLIYDPITDAFTIVEIDLTCSSCGADWALDFPPSDAASLAATTYYGYDYDIKSDKTQWSSSQVANLVRITSGKIRFYTGHYIYPFYDSGGTDDAEEINNDTVADQVARRVTLDGGTYRFGSNKDKVDQRTKRLHYAGAAMFPDWNIHADFHPDWTTVRQVTYQDGQSPIAWSDQTTVNAAVGQATGKVGAEFQGRTVGDALIGGLGGIEQEDHLRVYQLWETDGVCPACNGSGHVTSVYTGDAPTFTWEVVGGLMRPVCDNYRFDPANFGGITPSGEYPGTAGLTPATLSDHPSPSATLCPYCRGVGLRAKHRIRDIQADLFRGRSPQVSLADFKADGDIPTYLKTEADDVIYTDLDLTQTQLETWDTANERVMIHQGPQVQVEQSWTNYPYVQTWGDRNLQYATYADTSPLPPAASGYAHLEGWATGLTTNAGGVLGLGDDGKISPSDDLGCVHYQTTIVPAGGSYAASIEHRLGKVTFAEPVFCVAKTQYWTLQQMDQGAGRDSFYTHLLNGLHRSPRKTTTGAASKIPSGFWRHAQAWITCYYQKQGYFNHMADEDPVEVSYTDPAGVEQTYEVKAAIVDGRWMYEIRKLSAGATEFTTGHTARMLAMTDDSLVIESTEADLIAYPVPDPSYTPQELEDQKIVENLDYPRGRLLTWESQPAGLVEWEHLGYDTTNNALIRPRVYSWRLADDRPRMLKLAIQRLEAANNLRVQGHLVCKGQTRDIAGGLGYVNYPDRDVAAVVKITYNFGKGFETVLELTREEARMGTLRDTDENRLHAVERSLDTVVARQRQATSGAVSTASPAKATDAPGSDGLFQ
jgi:hypothetical protein